MTFSCQSQGICRLYHSNLIVLQYKGLGNGWPLIFNTKEIQIQMNCKTISSRTQKWSNLLYILNCFTQKEGLQYDNAEWIGLQSTKSHFSRSPAPNPKRGGYGHTTGLGKAGGGGSLQWMTHHTRDSSLTQLEKQKRKMSHHMFPRSKEKSSITTVRSNLAFGAEKKN